MSIERDIKILEYKILNFDKKIILYDERGISKKKIEELKILKSKYETQLKKILFG